MTRVFSKKIGGKRNIGKDHESGVIYASHGATTISIVVSIDGREYTIQMSPDDAKEVIKGMERGIKYIENI